MFTVCSYVYASATLRTTAHNIITAICELTLSIESFADIYALSSYQSKDPRLAHLEIPPSSMRFQAEKQLRFRHFWHIVLQNAISRHQIRLCSNPCHHGAVPVTC